MFSEGCEQNAANQPLLNSPPSQTILTAKNVVIATGGRPKFPANVSEKRHAAVFLYVKDLFLPCRKTKRVVREREKEKKIGAQSFGLFAGSWSGGARHHERRHLLAEEVARENVREQYYIFIFTLNCSNLRLKSLGRCRVYFRS